MSNLPNFPTIRPSLLLDFANSKQVDPRISFTRASTATYFDAQGVPRTAASGVPRIDNAPTTGECKGLLIEEARTNLLLNSLIDGTNLSTQTVTVAAVAHTISFYGPGSVNLSGAHSATVNGSAAYPTRTVFTFAPSAGSLVVGVTGDVKFAQLETGTFPTSFTPTGGSAVTRAAEVPTMTGTNFSEWYRQDEGTFVVEYILSSITTTCGVMAVSDGTDANRMIVRGSSTGTTTFIGVSGGATQYNDGFTSGAANVSTLVAFGYKTNAFVGTRNGAAPITDVSCVVPTVSMLRLGADGGGALPLNGHIKRIAYYPKRLTNAELQALTA